MPDSSAYNVGLGKAGLHTSSGRGGAPAIVDADVERGWQSLGVVTATASALTDVNDVPATLVRRLPPDGRNIEVRVLTNDTSGGVTVAIYGFPFDPGTGSTNADLNATDGNAAGALYESYAFTVSSLTADSPSVAATVDWNCSDSRVIDRRGYGHLAVVVTAVSGGVTASNGIEVVYRVF